ncbi:MAG: TolC family protein [Planctomycetales bacterium]|nr:TolC family protein [Planctomycetales bacterium]
MKAPSVFVIAPTALALWAVGLLGTAAAQKGSELWAPSHHAAAPAPESYRAAAEAPSLSNHPRLAPYLARAMDSLASPSAQAPSPSGPIPTGFTAWWDEQALRPTQAASLTVGIDELTHSALLHSPNVRALSAKPQIRDTYWAEENAAFDWRTFFETGYDDFNDPVGNRLTTGNNDDRFKDKKWHAHGGLRKTNQLGGEVELGQRLGAQRNNSRYLEPNPQGTSRLELNYTHPLLNGSGRFYNRSQIVLASLDSRLARDQLAAALQDHLLQVTVAYWDLYRARSRQTQRLVLYHAADNIYQSLVARQEVDSLARQVLRARSAVAGRRSEIVRASTQIENAEAQLRLLVNDPLLKQADELIPLLSPPTTWVDISMSDCLTTALVNRPDIAQAVRTLEVTSLRLGVARNELLPKLDLLMSTYVAGLERQSRVFSAWDNQFSDGRPGFSVGLLWEYPSGNRAAQAREQRRRWELQQASSEFENTVETSLTEVEIAVREVETTYAEMLSRYQAMLTASEETLFLSDRFKLLPGQHDSATLLLEDLLDSQERQADEEASFVDAQVNYSLSLIRLRRAMGTLLIASDQPG